MKIRTLALSLVLAALVAGCNRQGAAWEHAQQTNTVDAYQQFVQDYPSSPHADEARQQAQALERAQRWQQVKQTDTIAAYQQFLGEFSKGQEVQEAQQRLNDLKRQQQWQQLQDSQDVQALQAFVADNQGTPAAQQAQQRIDQLQAAAQQEQERQQEAQRRAEEASHTHRVQLAAFETVARADAGEKQLEKNLSSVLGDTGLEVQQAGQHYLVRTQPLTEQDAQALCKQIKSHGRDCLVVKR